MLARFSSSSARAARPLLEGVLVVELASVLAGPSAGQFLAELGATVIKVENTTTKGDVTRTWRLPSERHSPLPAQGGDAGSVDDASVTAYFSACNMGKKSVALDIRNPLGLDACHRLARGADVVLASYKPGDAEKLGVDYDTIHKLNPEIVYAQITGYGENDARAGYDAVIQAESGFQFMNGTDEPTKMPVAMMDLLASHQVKEGILAGLLRKEKHQRGSFVSVSLLGAGISSLANQGTGYLLEGVVPQRMGNDHPVICPYGTIFTCEDGGLVTLAIGSDAQWRALCAVLEIPDEISLSDRFRTNPLRVENREACKMLVQERVSTFSKHALLNALREAAVPAGGVNSMESVFTQPQAEELVFRRKDDGSGDAVGLRQIAFSEDCVLDLSAPPRYGQHTSQILVDYAGFSVEEVESLVGSGVADDGA
eukprot:g4613.t1